MPQASENLNGGEIIDNEEGSTSPPPAKMPRLLAKYRQHRGSHSNQKETITVHTQIAQNLEKIDSLKPEDISDNALELQPKVHARSAQTSNDCFVDPSFVRASGKGVQSWGHYI